MGLYYLGLINMDLEDYDKAAEYFSKVAEVRPNFDAAYLNLGVISELKGDLKQAEKHYKKSVELNPHNTLAQERLTQIYLKDKTVDKGHRTAQEYEHSGACKS